MRPKVFLPSVPTRYDPISSKRIPSIDLKPAMRYGELVQLVSLQAGFREDEIHEAIETLQEGLQNYTSEDYILCVGDPILMAAAITYATDLSQTVKVLRWDKVKREYDCAEITL
jgi:hypothetical protein